MADDGTKAGGESQREIELEKINDEIKRLESDQTDEQPPADATEPEQKPTQIDHLNKKLLSSFLDRLNSADNSVAFGLHSSAQAQSSEPTESDDKDFSS